MCRHGARVAAPFTAGRDSASHRSHTLRTWNAMERFARRGSPADLGVVGWAPLDSRQRPNDDASRRADHLFRNAVRDALPAIPHGPGGRQGRKDPTADGPANDRRTGAEPTTASARNCPRNRSSCPHRASPCRRSNRRRVWLLRPNGSATAVEQRRNAQDGDNHSAAPRANAASSRGAHRPPCRRYAPRAQGVA